MLQLNDFIQVENDGKHFVRLSDRGHEYLHSDDPVELKVYLERMIQGQNIDERANNLWDFIGPESSMFYVSGPAYFKTIRGYINGLGPSLTEYLDGEQRKSANGLKPNRMNYYRTLYKKLDSQQEVYFLQSLSDLINTVLSASKDLSTNELDDFDPFPDVAVLEEYKPSMPNKNKIFIVHGHNSAIRDRVELFVTHLGFEPIILFKEASKSRTVIEKLEQETKDCYYAIVLYTKCDEGREAGTGDLKPRARQNVVFEHGYMSAKVGRDHVCVLYEEGVECPSDLNGVIYVAYDEKGAWRMDIVKEMRAVGLDADANLIK